MPQSVYFSTMGAASLSTRHTAHSFPRQCSVMRAHFSLLCCTSCICSVPFPTHTGVHSRTSRQREGTQTSSSAPSSSAGFSSSVAKSSSSSRVSIKHDSGVPNSISSKRTSSRIGSGSNAPATPVMFASMYFCMSIMLFLSCYPLAIS